MQRGGGRMADAAKEAEEAAKKEKEKELAEAAASNKAEDVQRLLEQGVSADAKDLRNQYGRYVMIAMVDDRANLPQPKMWTLSCFLPRFD